MESKKQCTSCRSELALGGSDLCPDCRVLHTEQRLVWVNRGSANRPPGEPGCWRHVLGVLLWEREFEVGVMLLQDDPLSTIQEWSSMYETGHWSPSAVTPGPKRDESGVPMCSLPCPHHRVKGQSHGCELGNWWRYANSKKPKPKKIPCPVWVKLVAERQIARVRDALKTNAGD